MKVELIEIDEMNYRICESLSVFPRQADFICPNSVSLNDAISNSNVVKAYGIYVDGKMVGFTMLAFDKEYDNPDDRYWLWRLMIDKHYQRRGYGRAALYKVVDFFKENKAPNIKLSTKKENTVAINLCKSIGFYENGELNDDEIVFEKKLKYDEESEIEEDLDEVYETESDEDESGEEIDEDYEDESEEEIDEDYEDESEEEIDEDYEDESEDESDEETDGDDETDDETDEDEFDEELDEESDEEIDEDYEDESDEEIDEDYEDESDEEIDEDYEDESDEEMDEDSDEESDEEIDEEIDEDYEAESEEEIDEDEEDDEDLEEDLEEESADTDDEESDEEIDGDDESDDDETDEEDDDSSEEPEDSDSDALDFVDIDAAENSERTKSKRHKKYKIYDYLLTVMTAIAIILIWSYGFYLERCGLVYPGDKPCSTFALSVDRLSNGIFPWNFVPDEDQYFIVSSDEDSMNNNDIEDTTPENTDDNNMGVTQNDNDNDYSEISKDNADKEQIDANDHADSQTDKNDLSVSDNQSSQDERENTISENDVDSVSDDSLEAEGIDEEAVFTVVDESYFDDALFIGDSRMVGVAEYAGLTNATFYGKVAMNIYNLMDTAPQTARVASVRQGLKDKQFGKIYIMVGINEIGTGDTAYFVTHYKQVIDEIKELQPDAIIIVQAILHVAGEKSSVDKYFNNTNINNRNAGLKELANNKDIFYLDVNPVFDDANGNLKSEYTFDMIHLFATYYGEWKQFYLEHGIVLE